MSEPPDYPGRRRLKRAAAAAGSEAYQGAFEAIGSVLIAGGIGYWVDRRWETAPVGLLVGVVLGFAAMVLRLVRLGRELDATSTGSGKGRAAGPAREAWSGDDRGFGEAPGMSRALLDEREEKENEEKEKEKEKKEDRKAEKAHGADRRDKSEGTEPLRKRRNDDERR